ncbi:C4-dicarboxylate anaerobic carrier [Halorubrum lipolyticum DSM 21995]|uniref:C4-dicarboxylate anaerobic carrier n=1 Tax=Halorubrum lipolyticum DSM 21995 TaxID=1227482 RepID=M0NNP4_9EURY|nr:C4-dicarboxylate anaerobic carrier [Halorubrum lipolyticum DSM 21995]
MTSLVAVGLTAYLILYAYGFYWDRTQHTVLAMGWGIALYHLMYLMTVDRDSLRGKLDFTVTSAMFVGTVAFTAYIFLNYEGLRNRLLDYAPFEYLLAGLLLLIIVEATRRAYGNPFVAVIVVFVGYAYFGESLPGWLAHSGIDVQRLIEINVLTLDGIYGTVPRVGTTWVAIFLVYAGLLEGYGALNMVFAAGGAAEKRFRAGTAQTAVVASLLMGSINGSAVANTATTGSFTIPLMKERGIRSSTAAAIESAASSGGQVMPPIMGAAAFVMAGILNLPYIDVLLFALLPALLFYLSIAVSVQVVSLKQDIIDNPGSAESDADGDGNALGGDPGTFRRGLPLVVSVAVLVYYLAVAQLSPLPSAIRAIGVLVAGQFLWQFYLSGFDAASLRKTAGATVQGLQIGAVSNAPIFAVLGSIGILINLINVGSFTRLLTFAMLDQSGGSLLILLFFAMIMSIMFGMGMPTVAAYILVAIFIGPAIVEFGLDQIYAHMFVFYFAILSALTPPVALGCAVACKIADTGFLRTCWDAMKMALPVFLLPYTFVIHRNLLVWDAMTPVVFVTIALALFGVSFAVYNHIFQPLRLPVRLLVGVAALVVLFVPNSAVSVLGAMVILTVFGLNYVESKETPIGRSLPGSS